MIGDFSFLVTFLFMGRALFTLNRKFFVPDFFKCLSVPLSLLLIIYSYYFGSMLDFSKLALINLLKRGLSSKLTFE